MSSAKRAAAYLVSTIESTEYDVREEILCSVAYSP